MSVNCGGQTVGGVGTTIVDAENNARALAELAIETGTRCIVPSVLSTSNVSAVPGGFIIRFTCDGAGVTGFGATATDAGKNLFSFAGLLASDDMRCNIVSSGVSVVPGAYLAKFQCDGVWVTGFGTTTTDAGINANGFALLRADSGLGCNLATSDVSAVMGGFIPSFKCGSSTISGFGSTATDAGRNALGFSGFKAFSGRSCSLTTSGVEIFAYGYEATFTCGSRHPKGEGLTATAAGHDALINAAQGTGYPVPL